MTRTILSGLLCIVSLAITAQPVLKVGAKHFNEGYILGEMVALLLEDGGYTVERKFSLGGTAVCFEALRHGAIDVYPEYTGTITAEILQGAVSAEYDALQAHLARQYKLQISRPYGFSNTYALVMLKDLAHTYGIRTLSDLRNHGALRMGLSYEFLKRQDGWHALAAAYDLNQQPVGLEHGLAYQALQETSIDITDAYSTDGEIDRYDLVLLEDDRSFFPQYEAVSFYREGLPNDALAQLDKLTGVLTAEAMQALNAKAIFDKTGYQQIAYTFLVEKGLIASKSRVTAGGGMWNDILRHTGEHILLTLIALAASVAVAVPLGVVVYRFATLSRTILYITGILQTVPSIALLALIIPVFGIGALPAVVALFLYALLPVLRNTVSGLTTVDPALKKVALGMGMSRWQQLRLVEFPLALPALLTGIRTAAVITVGTATLAAFIGAGGLGEFIVTGLALNDSSLILQGAIPAALLAVVMELLFEWLERRVIPAHLRRRTL